MAQQNKIQVERIPHYVYVFLLYMFVVGYIYFISFFSVFNFNAIGYVGIVDLIKMATSSLFNVYIFPYSISMFILIVVLKKNDDRLFEVRMAFLSVKNNRAQKTSFLIYTYKKEILIAYVIVCSFFLFGYFMQTASFESYKSYDVVSFLWAALGYLAAMVLSYVLNLYLSAKNIDGPFIFSTIIILYFLECGFLSVVTGHNDATKIVLSKEFTYKVELNRSKVDSERFVWAFGDISLLWNPKGNSIIVSKTEPKSEYKHN